jgi:hypothetical protein
MEPRAERRKRAPHAGGRSNVMPAMRRETSHGEVIAFGLLDLPNGGGRTGGPQFTHRGA